VIAAGGREVPWLHDRYPRERAQLDPLAPARLAQPVLAPACVGAVVAAQVQGGRADLDRHAHRFLDDVTPSQHEACTALA
jgi:hypothetical protein